VVRIRILIFNRKDFTSPYAGGSETHLYEVARRLIKKGHDVTLFCTRYKEAKSYEIIDGIKIFRKGNDYTLYFHAFVTYLMKLRKECDIILDDINVLPFFTPLYVRKPKIAIQHHTIEKVFFIELPLPLAILGYLIERLIPFFYSTTKFIVVSQSTKKDLIELGLPEKNITIVYNGVNHKKYKPGKKNKYPRIIYLGRLEKSKRIDMLINAMSYILKEVPSVRLYIVGTGKNEEKLRELTKKLKLEKNVRFYGYVTERKKVRLLQDAWVLVSPSIREGWGLSILEANACGTPAIAFDVPGLRDSIRNEKTGLLLKSQCVFELAKAILNIIHNKKLRRELSKNAIKWSKKFDWDITAKKILLMLKRTLND